MNNVKQKVFTLAVSLLFLISCAPTDEYFANWLDLEALAVKYDFKPIDFTKLDTTKIKLQEVTKDSLKNESTDTPANANNTDKKERLEIDNKKHEFIGDYVYAKLIEDSVDILWLSFKGTDKQMSFSYFDKALDKSRFVSKFNSTNPLIKGKKCKITYKKELRPDSTIATKVLSIDIMDEGEKILAKGSTRGTFLNINEQDFIYLNIKNINGHKEEFIITTLDDPTLKSVYSKPNDFVNKQLELNWQILERNSGNSEESENMKEIVNVRVIEAPPPALTSPTNTIITYIMKLNSGSYDEAMNMIISEKRSPYDKFVKWADSRVTKNKTILKITPIDVKNIKIKLSSGIQVQECVAVSTKISYSDNTTNDLDLALVKVKGNWYIAE